MYSERTEFGNKVSVASGGFGLLVQRTQPTPYLTHEVCHPDEVSIGCKEPTLGALGSPSELRNACYLFDDVTAVLRTGVEHGINLALRNDYMAMTPDATASKQFGDIEKPTWCTVDGVLRITTAKQRAGDLHLAELDGQRARNDCRS